jgi:hypothetical protein
MTKSDFQSTKLSLYVPNFFPISYSESNVIDYKYILCSTHITFILHVLP